MHPYTVEARHPDPFLYLSLYAKYAVCGFNGCLFAISDLSLAEGVETGNLCVYRCCLRSVFHVLSGAFRCGRMEKLCIYGSSVAAKLAFFV